MFCLDSHFLKGKYALTLWSNFMYLLDLLMQHSSHRHVYFLKFSQIKKTKDINTPKHVNKGIAEQNIYLLVINIS